jgi:serine/threonine-protein kinase
VTDSSRTKTGMVLGTPSFMSPEQLAGQRVDGRSDLYSLGVTLYQLLTGQLPFRADSMAALMFQIANEPAAAVTVLRPDLPVELARVLQRLLAKSPADRHPSGEALATDLRRIAEQPIAASAHRPRPQDATSSVPRPGRGAPSAPPAATAPLGASEPDFRL